MKIARNIVFFTLIILAVTSCRKKKMQKIAGEYIGVERYIHIGPYGDTLDDEVYDESIIIAIKDRSKFLIQKAGYPGSYEVKSTRLLEGEAIYHSGLVPRHTWELRIEGDSLYGVFNEKNGWAGYDDYYYFKGKK